MHLIQMKNILKLELTLLYLLIVSLPSLEAPKNIFLVLFVIVASFRQINISSLKDWGLWDWIFLSIIGSALLSSAFPGIIGHEWKGFRVILTYIGVGWLVYRSRYSEKQISLIFILIILSTIPPLLYGCWQYLISHSKHDLQLHSVGHVNHSAIYLTIIFGASLAYTIATWKLSSTKSRLTFFLLSTTFYSSLIIGESRAALGVGFLLALAISILLTKNLKIKLAIIGSIIGISICAFFLNAHVIQKEIDNQKANNVLSSRDKVWNISIEAARFHPLLGVGLDNWGAITPEEIKKSVEARGETYDPTKYFFAGHSHNLFLTVLVERGFIGLFVILLFMFAWLRHLIKTFHLTQMSAQASYLWGGAFSAWLVTFGVGTVNTTLHHEHGILACLLLGLYLSYSRNESIK